MRKVLFGLVAVSCVGFAGVGCAPAEQETTGAGAAMSSTAEVAKCETCGKEYPKAELHNHGGKLVCASCDSH